MTSRGRMLNDLEMSSGIAGLQDVLALSIGI